MPVISSDGVTYTNQQYRDAEMFVRGYFAGRGARSITTNRWEVVGAIAGYADGVPFEFYMRDLVLGKIRHHQEAAKDYQRARKVAEKTDRGV